MRSGAIALAIAVSACSNTIAASRPLGREKLNEINGALQGNPASVVVSGTPGATEAQKVTVGPDATVLDGAQQVQTEAIDRITVLRRSLGALEGLGIGFASGALGGALIGLAAKSGADPDCNNSGACIYPLVGGVAGALVGVLAGGAIGAVIGHRTNIEFATPGGEGGAPSDCVRGQELIDRILHRKAIADENPRIPAAE
jgi:hypothetical protein